MEKVSRLEIMEILLEAIQKSIEENPKLSKNSICIEFLFEIEDGKTIPKKYFKIITIKGKIFIKISSGFIFHKEDLETPELFKENFNPIVNILEYCNQEISIKGLISYWLKF